MSVSVVRLLFTSLLGVATTMSAAAAEIVHGQVVSVDGGNFVRLIDADHRERRLRLAYIDAPELGQPFGNQAQAALSSMVLGREVTARLLGEGEDGVAQAEVSEPHGHVVNLELVNRGLAWHDYFDEQAKPERDQYQAALSAAQSARLGMWSLDQLEAPRDYRARSGQGLRWWLYAVAALSSVTLLGLVFSAYDKHIAAWLERQDELIKSSAEAHRLARIQDDAEEVERDRNHKIANREMERLAALRRAAEHQRSG